MSSSGTFKQNADAEVKNLDGQIADLQAKIAQLTNQREAARNRSSYFASLPVTGPSRIRQLNVNIISKNNQITNNIQPDLDQAVKSINDFNSQIAKIQSTIQDINAKANQVNIFITVSQNAYNQILSEYQTLSNKYN